VADSPDTVTTVCRFLALLELFREAAVAFDQVTPLGELTIRWTGTDDGEIDVSDEFDESPTPEDGTGEAPVVDEDPDFLEPGDPLTEGSADEPAVGESTVDEMTENETVEQ
jgi:segregation and condensation protein A